MIAKLGILSMLLIVVVFFDIPSWKQAQKSVKLTYILLLSAGIAAGFLIDRRTYDIHLIRWVSWFNPFPEQ